jgi:hypothetical protein
VLATHFCLMKSAYVGAAMADIEPVASALASAEAHDYEEDVTNVPGVRSVHEQSDRNALIALVYLQLLVAVGGGRMALVSIARRSASAPSMLGVRLDTAGDPSRRVLPGTSGAGWPGAPGAGERTYGCTHRGLLPCPDLPPA